MRPGSIILLQSSVSIQHKRLKDSFFNNSIQCFLEMQIHHYSEFRKNAIYKFNNQNILILLYLIKFGSGDYAKKFPGERRPWLRSGGALPRNFF